MITRDGTASSASFFSSQTLFEFIYRMQTDREHEHYLPLVFYILHNLFNIFLFLAVPTIGLLDLRAIFNSINSLIVFGSLLCLILLQIMVHLLKQKSFYLIEQITALCFVLQPLLLVNTISLIYSQGISQSLGFVICLSSQLVSVMLLYWLLFETYRTYSLRCQGSFITVEMIMFQLLLIALSFVGSTTIEIIMQVVLLMTAVKCYAEHFIEIEMDCEEYLVLKGVNVTHITMSSILVLIPILGQNSSKPLFVFIGAIMLLFLAISLFHQQKIDETMFRRLFQYEAGYDQILKTIDFFSGLLRKKGQNQPQELRRFIFAAAYEHNKQCCQSFCQFSSITTQEELKDLSNKSLKQLTQKILRKFQTILEQYHKQFADSKDVVFNYLKFYAHVLNSRHKLQKLLAQTSHLHLSWAEQYQFYHYGKICEVLENTEAIDATKVDEDIIDFQNSLVSTLSLMQEFWLEFSEQKVDLKKIIILSTKITPSKAKLDQIYQKKIHEEKFAAYKILTLYALYQRYILNQVKEAIKIEDYAKILADRLKDKQEVQYLSKETEAGFIVISLSQTKLGSIYMMSDLALNLFKYTRKDIIGRNVSNVMPIVFANNHDNILIDFLKKKRRTFNTDLRLLLGRDSNGFIFPVHLQLQKASYSANDEFIFIAMVKPDKLRNAPLYCLLDHEGYIRQFTASFQHTFMKNHNKNRLKSIQQLIPTYFDDNYSEDMIITRTFTMQISNHKLGDTTATYTVIPIVVKGEHLGFLTKVTYKELPIRQFFKNERMTDHLMTLRNEEELYSFDNQYNHRQNWFEVEKKNLELMPVKQNTNFTLPFLSYQDFASFAKREEKKQYGTDIKTIRYVKNHFQRKQDDQSFHSEVFSEGGKTDVQAKIAEMRHRTQKKGQSTRIDALTLGINVVLVGIIVLLTLAYSIYNEEPSEEAQLFQTYSFEKKVRYLLPEYIIYSTLVDQGINSAQNQGKMELVKTELIYSLAKSPLAQSQKESILKIIYVHSDTYMEQALQNDLQSINLQDQHTITYLYIFWALILGLCLVVIALEAGIISSFKDTQLGVYTVFLSLKEPAIRQIYEACRNLIRRINIEVNKVQEDEQLLQLRKDNEDENEIEKLKQFKVTSTPQDMSFWLQMIVPVALLIALFLATMMISVNQFNHFMSLKLVINDFYEVVPATSIEFMKVVYEAARSKPLPVSSNFIYYMQSIESNVVRFQHLSNSGGYDFLNVLYGDICSNTDIVSSIQSLSCEMLGNSILTNGISPTLNYLSEQFLQVSISSTEGQARLNQLIEINYMFINPVLVKMAGIMEGIVNSSINQNSLTQTRLAIVGIVLTIVFSLYLLLFPLKRIQQEITTTHAMITLMPPDPEDTIKPNNN